MFAQLMVESPRQSWRTGRLVNSLVRRLTSVYGLLGYASMGVVLLL